MDAAYGERRADLAVTLFERLARDQGKRFRVFGPALGYAARILDIGRSVDFFDRHEHAARIVLASELDGFSQVEVARIAAILHAADEEGIDLDEYAPLVTPADRRVVERAAVLLLLADDLMERAPRGTRPSLKVTQRADRVEVHLTRVSAWRPRGLGDRFLRTFKKTLVVDV